MQLPFTTEQFLDVMTAYNAAVGAAPVLLLIGAIAAALLMRSRFAWRHRAIIAMLAVLWFWAGAVYHLGFFTRINPAARAFGVVFIAQAVVLVAYALRPGAIQFAPGRRWSTVAGFMLVAYALVAYPLLGWAAGHGYPNGPSFGTPCPVTLYFFGMMLFARAPVPIGPLVIPLAWAAVGTSAAVLLGIREDLGLAVGAVLVIVAAAGARTHWHPSARARAAA